MDRAWKKESAEGEAHARLLYQLFRKRDRCLRQCVQHVTVSAVAVTIMPCCSQASYRCTDIAQVAFAQPLDNDKPACMIEKCNSVHGAPACCLTPWITTRIFHESYAQHYVMLLFVIWKCCAVIKLPLRAQRVPVQTLLTGTPSQQLPSQVLASSQHPHWAMACWLTQSGLWTSTTHGGDDSLR